MVIMVLEVLPIFPSPQVKWSIVITNNNGKHELSHVAEQFKTLFKTLENIRKI